MATEWASEAPPGVQKQVQIEVRSLDRQITLDSRHNGWPMPEEDKQAHGVVY